MFTFKFYEVFNKTKKCKSVKAVSSYEGKTVIGVADLHPDDTYDFETGKEIARLRCEQKLLKKKKKRFFRKAKDTEANAEALRVHADKLVRRANQYVETALSCDEKIVENAKKLDELLNKH